MASLTNWLWGTSQIDDAVDKATSELIPAGTEEVALNLEICDQIRSKFAPAKDAMRALKRRLNHKNPNVQVLALGLTDICVKNGGDHFLTEIASREFIDNLVSILKMPGLNHAVRSDILKYIQNWALAFEGKSSLSYVGQIYRTLKAEGYDFPPKDLALANSAMVDTSTAPEWIDSDVCLRCRTPFTFTNRKHHCRNCGQVFDQQCSSKSIPLPHFGITQPVRVCDGCHSKLLRKSERIDKGRRQSASMYSPRNTDARDLFDAELQRAIQLSLEEVGASSASTKRPGYVPYQPQPYSQPYSQSPQPPTIDRTTYPDKDRRRSAPPGIANADDENDPDLKAAIEASLREANMPKPSAPTEIVSPEDMGLPASYPPTVTPTPTVPKIPNYDLEPLESDVILTFSQTIEQVQSQGGRDMSRYPAVSELFDKANGLRPKLAMSLDDTGRKEQLLSEMHEKLSQAVKLYDKLLTDQISQPAWRRTSLEQTRVSALPAAPVHAQNGYAQPQGLKEYNQWAPSSSAYAHREDSTLSQIPQSPAIQTSFQPAYAPPPPLLSGPSYSHPSYSHNPSMAEQEPQRQIKSPPTLPVSPPPPQPFPSTQATQGYQPVSILHATPLGGNVSGTEVRGPGLGTKSSLPPPPHDSRPQPITQHPPAVSSTTTLPSPTIPTSTSSIARARTVSSRPSIVSPPPLAQPPSLARSATVSYAQPAHTRPQSSYAQPAHGLQQPPHTSPPQPQFKPALPAFPTVPTSTPQAFDLYAPSVPSVPPQERKEEMLIEL